MSPKIQGAAVAHRRTTQSDSKTSLQKTSNFGSYQLLLEWGYKLSLDFLEEFRFEDGATSSR